MNADASTTADAPTASEPCAPDLSDTRLQHGLQAHLAQVLGGPVQLSAWRRYASGFSWMTFGFTLSQGGGRTRELIVQVGPPSGLFAPYRAAPLASVLDALNGSAVPVARLLTWSDDPALLGAPFFVCDKVAGEVLEPWRLQAMAPEQRRALAEHFIGILGHLHAPTAPVAALLDEAPGITLQNAALQDLQRWDERLTAWSDIPMPLLTWAAHWLHQHAPAAPRLVIVHGDYRLGNFLSQGTQVSAVLDWEMVHAGHPFEDLGWLFSLTFNNGSDKLFGVLPRAEALQRYQTLSGLAVSARELHYFECLALYKSIAITVAARHSAEHRGFNDMRMVSMATQIAVMCRQLDRLIEAAP